VDQRGLDRPSGGRCDIGAFEAVILPNRPYNDQFETLEDTALTVPAPGVLSNDTFEEASVELLEAPLNGSLSLEPNGALAYLPDGDFFGLDGFTYQANGLPARVLLRVVPVTDAPIIGRPQGVIAQRAYELQWTCVEDAHGHALAFRVEKALDASMQNMIGNREISATGQSQHGLTLHLREGSTWVRVSVITPWGEASSETIELRYTQDGEPLDAGNDSDEGSGSGDTEAGDVGERDTEDEEIAAPDDVEERDAMADEVTPDPDERVEMTRPSKQGEGCSSAPGHPYDQGGAIFLLLVFLAWRPGRH
jgi:hypothetical protein